jgi:TetR/AcrR family transcriptional regulator, tetracycline repressor protein
MSRGLSKVSIVRAALGLLDEAGLEGLTVRAVAARLGVQAPALYWHVRSKQELLGEMATEIWRQIGAELAALPPDLPWRQGMIAFAAITRRALLAHRDGAKVFSGTYLTDAGVLERHEEPLRRMIEQGFTQADVIRAHCLLYNFTIGFCIEEQAVAQAVAAGDDRYALPRRAARLDAEANPLAAAVGAGAGQGPEVFADPDGRFDDLVAVIIQATDRMRGSPLRSAARVAAAAAATAARQRRQAASGPGGMS